MITIIIAVLLINNLLVNMPVVGFKSSRKTRGSAMEGGALYQVVGGQAMEGGALYEIFGGQAMEGGVSYVIVAGQAMQGGASIT